MPFFTLEQIARSLGREVIDHTKPCSFCGHHRFIVEAASGLHAEHLRCAQCGRGGMWLSKAAELRRAEMKKGPRRKT
jgi:hypothetical protein